MKTYKVEVRRKMIECAEVEVEASSKKEAINIIQEELDEGDDYDWTEGWDEYEIDKKNITIKEEEDGEE